MSASPPPIAETPWRTLRSLVRPLWPIEQAVIEAAAHDYPASADALREQIDALQVVSFRNTGGGFFSTVHAPSNARRLVDKSPLDVGTGSVDGIEHGMGFLVFLEDGHPSVIEGYAFAAVSTNGIDFSSVSFDVKPWSTAGD